ncbi:MAG: hypothetical protein AB4426_19135 [Xenococcaceae cyanobacterium]
MLTQKWINSSSKKALACSFIALLIYIFLVAFSPRKLIYDEVYYMGIAKDYIKSGFTPYFIENISGHTGILYSIVHAIFSPLTNYSVPHIRFVNVFLLFGCYLLILIWLKVRSDQTVGNALLNSGMWLAAPTAGVIGCMALTELPSIFICLLSTLMLIFAYNQGKWRGNSVTLVSLMVSGVFLGLSTWGRQNFIVVLVASLPFFLPLTKKSVIFGFSYALPTLLIFTYPILIWKGLVPPAVSYAVEGYRFSNFILSFGYLGLIAIILFPRLIIVSRQSCLRILLVSSFLVATFGGLRYVPTLGNLDYAPNRSLLERILGNIGVYIIPYLTGIIFTSLAVLFLYSIFKEALSKKTDSIFLYCIISILLIGVSNIKIAHAFSSRYITLALPFLIYIASYKTEDRFFLIRFTFSFILSLLSILNYYEMLL